MIYKFIDKKNFSVWVIPSKYKKDIIITNNFQKILNESNRKPNKIWVDKGSKLYNRSMKLCFQDNNIEMYSTFNQVNLLLLTDLLEP